MYITVSKQYKKSNILHFSVDFAIFWCCFILVMDITLLNLVIYLVIYNCFLFLQKSHLDNMEAHSSGSDTRESHLPLLKNNHTTNDSGFGGSTLNTNGNSTEPNSLDKNKKYSIQNGGIVQNGVIGNHEKHLQQNGSVVSYPVINESTDISTNNEELQVHSETSFISVGMSGDSELNSGYTDMDMHTSDEDSSSFVQSSNFSNSFSNKKAPKLIISDPSVRGDQKTKESSYIDSYCEQGESSYNIES